MFRKTATFLFYRLINWSFVHYIGLDLLSLNILFLTKMVKYAWRSRWIYTCMFLHIFVQAISFAWNCSHLFLKFHPQIDFSSEIGLKNRISNTFVTSLSKDFAFFRLFLTFYFFRLFDKIFRRNRYFPEPKKIFGAFFRPFWRSLIFFSLSGATNVMGF